MENKVVFPKEIQLTGKIIEEKHASTRAQERSGGYSSTVEDKSVSRVESRIKNGSQSKECSTFE